MSNPKLISSARKTLRKFLSLLAICWCAIHRKYRAPLLRNLSDKLNTATILGARLQLIF